MSLSSFFKKVTKEEYQKEMEERMGHSVVLTEAIVHTPSTQRSPTQTKDRAREQVKGVALRGRRDSNVSRAESEETDGIEVIEVVGGYNGEANENGDGAEAEQPAKISTNLFRRKAGRSDARGRTEGIGDDVSVDVDFFSGAAPDLRGAEKKLDEDTASKPRAREGKISLKLFGKKRGRKSEATKRTAHEVADENSVDFDFLSTSRKRPPNDDEGGGGVEKPPSPQLFKPSKRRKRGAATGKNKAKLSYDSDSLDVDVLSSLAAKSFGSGPSPETSPNAFTALMKKPLADNYSGKPTNCETKTVACAASSLAQNDGSPTGNKENALGVETPEQRELGNGSASAAGSKGNAKNNAFARLMTAAKKKGVWEEQEQVETVASGTVLPVATGSGDEQLSGKVQEAKSHKKSTEGSADVPVNDEAEAVENTTPLSDPPQEGNQNAFTTLMKAAREQDAFKKTEETDATSRPASPPENSSVVDDKTRSVGEGKTKVKTRSARARPKSGGELREEDEAPEAQIPSRPRTPQEHEGGGGSSCEESTPTTASGRRSSRIQKNREAMERRRREQESLEKLLDEQIAEKKNKKAEPARKRHQSRKDEEEVDLGCGDESDDEVRVERIISTPARKRTKKASEHLAPIFVKGRKEAQLKANEHPEKVAARRAFLMSAVPDVLRAPAACGVSDTNGAPSLAAGFPPFPNVSHVRQDGGDSDSFWRLQRVTIGPFALKSPTPSMPHRRLDCPPSDEGFGQFSKLFKSHLDAVRVEGERGGGGVGGTLNPGELPRRLAPPQVYNIVVKMIEEPEMRRENTFLPGKVFASLVKRKLECDALEAEARSKNLTVNELEEEHSRRRGRRRGRGKKRQDPRGAEKAAEPITVTYDPSTPNSMQWTKKYAPQSAADIVGNSEVVQRLRQWLQEWSARRKKASKSRRKAGAVKRGNSNRSNASSSNSFVVSDDDDYDDETSSDDGGGGDDFSDWSLDGEEDFPPNTALLSGPTGVGKTATVHALARQLGFKVLEVNASSLRGGRQVTAQLQEATQSHHVKNKKLPFGAAPAPSARGGGSVKDPATKSARGGGSGGSGGGSHLNKTALILFEDVDVVFEEDEGFYAAINSLASTTKRPVILTTSNDLFSARKFLKCEPKSFVFSPVPPSLTARHLRLLGLCEGFALDVRGLERLVEFNGGAVSRSILDLQYWTTTSSPSASPALTSEKRGTGAETTLHGGNKIGPEHSKGEERESSTSNAERNTGGGGGGGGGSGKGKEASQGDSLAKLMSVNEREALQEGSCSSGDEMRFYRDAVANAFSASENGGHLFGDLGRVQDLWLNGFAELCEMNKDTTFPFPCRAGARPERKHVYPLEAEGESEAEGGGRLKNRAFLADSESDTDDDAKSDQEQVKSEAELRAKADRIPRTETEKAAFRRTKAALAQLGGCAEISSLFVRAADLPPWWTKQAAASPADAKREYDQLGLEMGATAQFLAVSAARKAANELKENAAEAEAAASLSIDSIEFVVKKSGSATDRSRGGVCSEALNSVLEMTVNPQPQVLDVMPVLRGMARTEEMRRAGKGGGKRSRSGRFLHYFEAQEIYLKPTTVIEMCNTFL